MGQGIALAGPGPENLDGLFATFLVQVHRPEIARVRIIGPDSATATVDLSIVLPSLG